ncbi:MAG: hypothetical protein LBK54_10225 [Propionibacteriaceae bacterium]|jgi:hypothetical protein|nr:hypothetical protein [Propionibacteriaceae bacterium]
MAPVVMSRPSEMMAPIPRRLWTDLPSAARAHAAEAVAGWIEELAAERVAD